MIDSIGRIMLKKAVPKHIEPALSMLHNATKKDIKKFFQHVATHYPSDYKEVVYNLKKLGYDVSTKEGSSFSLTDFTPSIDKKKILKPYLDSIKKTDKKNLPRILASLSKVGKEIEQKTLNNAVKRGDVIARMVMTGTKGKPSQLNMMIGAPVIFTDHRNKPIPVPVVNSFAEGLDPHEYWAASYGARRGVLSEKLSIRDAGYLSKQLSAVANTLLITKDDCGTTNGILEDTKDTDNIGRFLARKEGIFPRNTQITEDVITRLLKQRKKQIMVRSPLTCEMEKGVCKYCTGLTEKNSLPNLGDNVGSNAAASMSEPIVQMTLSLKHSGGVVGSGQGLSGFKLLNQLITIPKTFSYGATLAEKDGKVTKIEKAPQGGHFIFVDNIKHYSPIDRKILKKNGDTVEAGDMLTDGVVNPADVTRLKGIGVARKYLADKLNQVMLENGAKVWKPNIELVARNMINHVQVQDPEGMGDALPDDIVEFSTISKSFDKDTKKVNLKEALGKQLGENVSYLTIGTRVTPSVINELKKAGKTQVNILSKPLDVMPVMLRSMDVPSVKPDWMAQLGATYLKRNLLKSLTRGAVSRYHGIYYEPALAVGKEFGKPPRGEVGY